MTICLKFVVAISRIKGLATKKKNKKKTDNDPHLCRVFSEVYSQLALDKSVGRFAAAFVMCSKPENYLSGVREDPRVGLHAAQRCLGDVNQTNPAVSSRHSCSAPLVRPRVNNHVPAANQQAVSLQWG